MNAFTILPTGVSIRSNVPNTSPVASSISRSLKMIHAFLKSWQPGSSG